MTETPSGKKHYEMAGTRPWRHIWTQPERVSRFVSRYQPEHFLHRHYALLGVMFVLAVQLPSWLLKAPHPVGVLIQLLLLGPIGGMMAGYVQSEMLRFTGKWLGGTAPKADARITIAWTNLPFSLAYFLFWITYLPAYFSFYGMQKHGYLWRDSSLFWLPLGLAGAAFVWALILRVRAVAEVQGISAGKAALNLLLTLVLAGGPVLGAIYLYYVIAIRSFQILSTT